MLTLLHRPGKNTQLAESVRADIAPTGGDDNRALCVSGSVFTCISGLNLLPDAGGQMYILSISVGKLLN